MIYCPVHLLNVNLAHSLLWPHKSNLHHWKQVWKVEWVTASHNTGTIFCIFTFITVSSFRSVRRVALWLLQQGFYVRLSSWSLNYCRWCCRDWPNDVAVSAVAWVWKVVGCQRCQVWVSPALNLKRGFLGQTEWPQKLQAVQCFPVFSWSLWADSRTMQVQRRAANAPVKDISWE